MRRGVGWLHVICLVVAASAAAASTACRAGSLTADRAEEGTDGSRIAAAPRAQATSAAKEPELISPAHGATVPGPRVVVRGRVPPASTPFLAVAPLNATPRIWIQPRVVGVRRNGMFDGIVYLGTPDGGVGEKFTILVFACDKDDRYTEGEVVLSLPTDCRVSEPVTVTRTS